MVIDKIGAILYKNIWIDLVNGDDFNGDGTYENPYKSYERVFSEIKAVEGYFYIDPPRIKSN